MRLARVYIENAHYEKIISRFDREHTFFYIDPPYFGCEDYYGKNIFNQEDFACLGGILSGITGRFILSINDIPVIREIYKSFRIEEVRTRYNINVASSKKREGVTELLVMNF